MPGIPLEHGLAVAGILFCLGLVGLMVRRNILFVHGGYCLVKYSLELNLCPCAASFNVCKNAVESSDIACDAV